MARPQKNSCDYFTHDNDMRNHRKVKSIRNKFGIQGYAIWSMLLEYLTGIDGNEFEYSDLEFELISGDFGVSVTEIHNVVDYCIKLEMLFVNNGFVYSESLNNRLAPVYKKRGVAKEISEKQKRNKGKFANSTVTTVVSVTEIPQSKVNKSKENDEEEEKEENSSSSSPNKFDFQNLNYEESVELFNKHKKHFFSIYSTELNAKEQIVFYANEICSIRHDLIRVEYELLPFDTNQFLGVLKSKITGSFEMFYRELKILKNYSCFEDKESELKKDLYLVMEDLIKEYKFKGFNEFQHIFNSFKKRASKNLVQKSKSVTVGNYA